MNGRFRLRNSSVRGPPARTFFIHNLIFNIQVIHPYLLEIANTEYKNGILIHWC